MSILDDLFGGGKEKAAEDAQRRIQQGMDAARQQEQRGEQAFDPYMQNRGDILNQYRQALAQGADPTAFLNQIMSQYRMSPEVQNQINYGTQAANRAAAASGMLGSSAEQQEVASRAQAMRSQDMQNFLNRVFGLRSQYLGGLGGLEQQGFGASRDVANMRDHLGDQLMGGYGQLGAAEGAGDMAKSGALGGLLGGIGSIAGGLMGGPFGAMLGQEIGGQFGPSLAQSQGRSYVPSIPRF